MSVVDPGETTMNGPLRRPASGDRWRLRGATATHVDSVASWSTSASEARRWAALPQHPFPPAAITRWWLHPDVAPWLLVDPEDVPVAYGEIWDDPEQDEVELARLIVDPHRRRQGVGRRLVDRLLEEAGHSGRADCFLRVVPDNAAALALYRTSGFRDVDDQQAAAWNEHEPTAYVWLQKRLGAGAGPTHPSH